MPNPIPSPEAIEEAISDAQEIIQNEGSRFFGLSYEQGVEAALRWVNGDEESHPLEV